MARASEEAGALRFAFYHYGDCPVIPTILIRSLRQHNPAAYIVQCSDKDTPKLEWVDEVFRPEVDPNYPMLARTEAFSALPHETTMFLDTDMICVQPLDIEKILGSAQAAVCVRSYGLGAKVRARGYNCDLPEYRDKTYGDVYPYLGCAAITRGRPRFWADCARRMRAMPEKFWRWFGDQEAIRDTVNSGSFRVVPLHERTYACVLGKDDDPDPAIIHFKGKVRKFAMLDAARAAGLITEKEKKSYNGLPYFS